MSSRVNATPTINQRATEANVIAILQGYGIKSARLRVARRAGLQSPRLDGMPHGTSTDNVNESRIVRNLGDEEELEAVKAVLEELEPIDAAILKHTYMHPLPSRAAIQERVGLEHSQLYRRCRKALVQFAQLWPLSNLVVYD
ncbi:hypothetical protein [Lacticaseibacillus pantheris]|uniref:hypothetical protein n=1 Tax=Lacticaseibacillus pantheris TaxID=171523 RepID=UPI0006D2085F|nr:hypothetical protein [Lacticaseibacillus pantheris]